ncbi:MAG: NADH-quinone oxidoreductase subunit L [Planctomycetes bacterium]|nr:NADH-quinone oxidoreductase subunit L [Planctomycetota bacterium]
MMPYAFIIAWLLPLVGFVVLVFRGRRIGEPRSGYLAAGLMLTAAAISLVGATRWVIGHPASLNVSTPWLRLGSQWINFGVHIDSLTIVMFTMVTVVASCIFIYSIGYMQGDPRFPRFFTYLSLFGFSMLGLILADSLIGLFIFWELVGLCSYFLIGFWFEKTSASNAAKKAFIVNRVGDCLFLIGIATMLGTTGVVSLESVFNQVRQGAFAGHGGLLTFAGICLFFGAVGKSAQFPLHVWLPDAMEGPTPVSALIHAATMVAAGVYLVGRIFPLLTPTALLFVAYIGAITLIGSALIAIVMTDIKRVLAYSTISQLGYMILALGVGGWAAGLFHLITHACFKALLFLGSGSVIHGCHGEQDIRKMGQLHRKMPITSITFLIATLAIAGVPLLSGFYSKDAILASALGFTWTHRVHGLLFILPAVAAAITAFYMLRLYLLTFWTQARDEHVHHHAHESPKVMWVPLAVLAVLTVFIGWGGKMPERHSLGEGRYQYEGGRGLVGLIAEAQPQWAVSWQMQEAGHPSVSDVSREEADAEAAHEEHGFHLMAMAIATSAMLAGVLMAWLVYSKELISAGKATQVLAPVHKLLWNKFYFDELYRATFVAGILLLASFGKWFDRVVLDGLADGSARWMARLAFFSGLTLDNRGVDGLVNGAARLALVGGNLVRKAQTGRVRNYILALTTGGAVIVLVFVWIW